MLGQPLSQPAVALTPIETGETTVRIAKLEIRPLSRQVLGDGARVQLTGRELEVLMVLIEQPDRVLTRETIYRRIWGGPMPRRDRSVDVYVRRVREKLRVLAPGTAFIHTHVGIGYRFWPQSSEGH